MASIGSAGEIWRRALDLNLRYYSAFGKLTADYVREFVTTLGEVRSTPSVSRPTEPNVEPPPASPKRTAVMVLEEVAGGTALGVFVVENNLGQAVSARPVASAFVDPTGRQVRPVVKFEPETVSLASGEQLLVRIMATIDETLEPDVRYQGEVTIPELSGTQIPIIVRRRAASDVSPSPAESATAHVAPSSKRRSSASRPAKQRGKPSAQRKS